MYEWIDKSQDSLYPKNLVLVMVIFILITCVIAGLVYWSTDGNIEAIVAPPMIVLYVILAIAAFGIYFFGKFKIKQGKARPRLAYNAGRVFLVLDSTSEEVRPQSICIDDYGNIVLLPDRQSKDNVEKIYADFSSKYFLSLNANRNLVQGIASMRQDFDQIALLDDISKYGKATKIFDAKGFLRCISGRYKIDKEISLKWNPFGNKKATFFSPVS